MRARTATSIRVDGVLDEADWSGADAATGFRQVEPNQGEAPDQMTRVKVRFDNRYLYLGFWALDSLGRRGERVVNLRRDFDYLSNDLVGAVFDPFLDRRNAQAFQTTPYGNQSDLLVFDDNLFDRDWDTPWRVRTARTDTGWTAEMAIPWASLRYPKPTDSTATWGLQLERTVRRSNQKSGWSPWPRAYSPYRMAYAGEVTGLVPPPPSRLQVRLQPYATLRTERLVAPTGTSRLTQWDAGGEVRWTLSPNDFLDLTFNTDFAQADVDRQVNNLTRFTVFFPERRQFFLDNASLFTSGLSELAQPFFSRRIGLADDGTTLPIEAGGRFVSRTAKQSFGGLVIQQGADASNPASQIGVGRYQRNIGKQSTVGVLATYRYDTATETAPSRQNQVYSADGIVRITQDVGIEFSAATSLTTMGPGNGYMGHVWGFYNSNNGYVGYVFGIISPDFAPGVGFVGRNDIIWNSPAFYLNWRPDWRGKRIRAFEPGGGADLYHAVTSGALVEARVYAYPIYLRWHTDAKLVLTFDKQWQLLSDPFVPLGITISPNRYTYESVYLDYNTDPSRKLSTQVSVGTGGYFDGWLTNVRSTLRYSPLPNLSIGAEYSAQVLENLGETNQSLTTHLVGPEIRVALNPRLQLFSLYQYNSFQTAVRWNVRFAWEVRPLSFVYLVWNENAADELVPITSDGSRFRTSNQMAIVKLSYVHQF
ncbi:MAG: DUF5916 domain-containing protein [Bacteroidia bacterium]|nr:DUF5916 domain-containing protein [Bacteroidia bacterium]